MHLVSCKQILTEGMEGSVEWKTDIFSDNLEWTHYASEREVSFQCETFVQGKTFSHSWPAAAFPQDVF